jgi:hypothetical protein
MSARSQTEALFGLSLEVGGQSGDLTWGSVGFAGASREHHKFCGGQDVFCHKKHDLPKHPTDVWD